METKNNKTLIKNTIMLYVMNIAKLILPLISLPYLVRVLSVDCYGSVSFVKSLISYMQILIDFGFGLSATKEIVILIKNKGDIGEHVGHTMYAQIILSFLATFCMFLCIPFFKILKGYELFTLLYLLSIILSVFLFEYVFRAFEQMGKISIRYIIMKSISLVLTLIFVKGDSTIILMPIFDIIATIIATIMVLIELKKMDVHIKFNIKAIKPALKALKTSFVYFISNFATTAFSILNTLIIGIFLTKADVAYWSLAIQMAGIIQCLYDPIISSVFPIMIREKRLKIIHNIMLIYMPLIVVGCCLILLLGNWAVTLVFTSKYLPSAKLLKCLIPLLFLSFPAMLYGWPCLGSIDKQKLATISTISAAIFQALGLVVLILINHFTLIGIVIIRNLTELILCVIRMISCYRNKNLFVNNHQPEQIA